MEKRGLGRRRKLGWDRRLNRSAWAGRAKLCAIGLSALFLSGCLGIFGPAPLSVPGSAILTGAVKIVTPSPSSPSGWGEGFEAGGVVEVLAAGPAAGTRASPGRQPPDASHEYLVAVDWGTGKAKVQEIARALGLVYEKEVLDAVHVVKDPAGRDELSVIRRLESFPEVLWARENGRVTLLGETGGVASGQWSLAAIRAYDAWRITDAAGVVVAVIDTGIDFAHPDLDHPALWVDGWDVESGREYGYRAWTDEQADDHGTAVAGIIGAAGGAGGFRGVAPGVRLMPIRAVFQGAREDDVIEGIRIAVEREAQVINLSLQVSAQGAPPNECSPAMSRALDEAAAAGMIIVAAAGNQGEGGLTCPASHPKVISVGAIDRTGRVPGYSSRGAGLDLVAPAGRGAGDFPTLTKGGGYDYNQRGTSFAAPHVSGVVALMLGKGFPQDPEKVRALLHMTAVRPDGVPGRRDDGMGYGRLDALGAVAAEIPRILLVRKEADRLAVHGETRPGAGGRYQLGGLPEGSYHVAGWVDVDGDGAVSPGDYYGEGGPVALRSGHGLTGVDFILQAYDGPVLHVERRL